MISQPMNGKTTEQIMNERKNIVIKLEAEEGKQLRAVDDIYVAAHVDEEGNEIEEHFPYYTTLIYLPKNFNDEEINNLYVEEEIK